MASKKKTLVLAAVALSMALSLGGGALAQTSPNFNLEWHLVGGGGGPSSSVHYRVSSAMGQAVSGKTPASSPKYRVEGGYEGGGGYTYIYAVYLPIVSKNHP
jgi:hypothetical protein